MGISTPEPGLRSRLPGASRHPAEPMRSCVIILPAIPSASTAVLSTPHTAYERNRLFEDRQILGPFAKWVL